MLKLARFLKKYSIYVIMAVVLLAAQAFMELLLPTMMSDIVNTGIQKGGINEISPKAIGGESIQFLMAFMGEDDLDAVKENYTLFSELGSEKQKEVLKTFPGAEKANAYVYTGAEGGNEETDLAIMRGVYGITLLFERVAEATGQDFDFSDSDGTMADFNLEAFKEMDFSMITQDMVQEMKEEAQEAPEMLMSSVTAIMNKSFYQALGANTDKIQTNYIMKTGLEMLVLCLFIMVCALGATFGFARMGSGVARDLRKGVFSKVMSFSSADMDNYSTSSLITRSTNDITQVQMMYTMGLRMLIFAPIMGAGGVIMALRKSSGMSWLIAVAVGVIMVVILVFYFVVVPKFKIMQKLVDRLNLVARENLTGMMVIRAFGTQDFQEERFEDANKSYTKNSLFVGRAGAVLMPVITLVMNALLLFIVWVGADQVSRSQMQVGDIMAFIQYAMHIVMSFMFIAMIFVMIPRAAVSAERINDILTRENEVKDPETLKTLKGASKGVVEFDNVSFKYPGADEYVLKDISFTAKPGQTTAFIGSTGSGKSTLINLIPRFYDVSTGKIKIDGVDVREISQKELRENIGYVPQKGLLFTGDIADNLRYGKPDATEEDLREAAEISQALNFIESKEDGFNSDVAQGGTNFSGGQRQRLSIARAVVKKAPVYIFDDSFSALDFATDSKLRKALKPFTKNSTVLIVAQRVSTIMNAEQIIVLDHGKIAGKGSHKDLLISCEAYREIAESQLSADEISGVPAFEGGEA